MNSATENPYSPPAANVEDVGRPPNKPWLCALGIVLGLFLGLLVLIGAALLMNILYLYGLLLFILSTGLVISTWRKRSKRQHRTVDFNLGLLLSSSFVCFLFLLILLLRQVPNDRKVSRQLPNPAFNPDPAASINPALSCLCLPVSVPRPACGWAG